MKKQVKIQESYGLNLCRFENGGYAEEFITNLRSLADSLELNIKDSGVDIHEFYPCKPDIFAATYEEVHTLHAH